MGKGDKKTKRGKIAKGTYGVRRKKREAVVSPASKTPAKAGKKD